MFYYHSTYTWAKQFKSNTCMMRDCKRIENVYNKTEIIHLLLVLVHFSYPSQFIAKMCDIITYFFIVNYLSQIYWC